MKQMIFAMPILTLILSLGCNGSADSDYRRAAVSLKQDGVEITAKAGGEKVHLEYNESGVPLPDGFPDDASIYPGSTVITGATSTQGYTVALQTQTPLKKVTNFYNQKLKKKGWKILHNSSLGPDGGMLQASKNNRSQYITFSQQAGTTTINLTVN